MQLFITMSRPQSVEQGRAWPSAVQCSEEQSVVMSKCKSYRDEVWYVHESRTSLQGGGLQLTPDDRERNAM